MINFFAKTLVLFHAVMSVAGMSWALMLFLQARDFGRTEPYTEVLEYTSEGKPKLSVLHASEYDKSYAAAKEAEKTRDRTYAYVKPAIDSIRATEPFLPSNHLFYRAEIRRLLESADKIEVKRLKDSGTVLDTAPGSDLGKPVTEDKAVDGIAKSYKIYQADLKKVFDEIDVVEADIRTIVNKTKKFTAELTGKDEANMYVQPGIYQLVDQEFLYQGKIRDEIDQIKPHWSKAVEQSRLYRIRHVDLEATLKKLQAQPAPKIQKKL